MRLYTVEARVAGNLWIEDSAHTTPSAALDRLEAIIALLPAGEIRLGQRVAN